MVMKGKDSNWETWTVQDIVIWGLKVRSVETADMAITREQPCKGHMTSGYRDDRGNNNRGIVERGVFYIACAKSMLVKVKVTLRPTISQPVHLGVRRPSGTRDQFFFLLEFFFQTVAVRYRVSSSLMRGRVCNLLLLLVPTIAVSLLSALSDERSGLSFIYIRYLHYLWYSSRMYMQYIQGIVQSRLGTAGYALVTSNLHNNDSLVTWTVIMQRQAVCRQWRPNAARSPQPGVVAMADVTVASQWGQEPWTRKLRNLRCWKPLPGNICWRHSRSRR
jgi:hypothetical protein